jgi:hypothetical protein
MATANDKKLRGAQVLPADADVDFVLHTPGRDYDFVEIVELDEDELEELESDDDYDEDDEDEMITGVWEMPRPAPRRVVQHYQETPWWEAAEGGVGAPASPRQERQPERSWWEAARMGLRAPVDEG